MEVIFEIRSYVEILANNIRIYRIYTIAQYVLQLVKDYKVCIVGDLHPLKGNCRLDMYNLFRDDYIAFVPGDITEFQNVYR